MKYYFWALFLPFLAHAASLTTLPQREFSATGVPLEIRSLTPQLSTISLRNPNYEIHDLSLNGQVRKLTVLDGEPFISEDGVPALPQVTRLFQIPNTGGAELVVRDAVFDLIEDYNPYPYHDPNDEEISFADAYRHDMWFPPNIVQISEPMIFRDVRIVAVTLFPVQVNPVTQQARLYSALEVDLVANSDPAVNELLLERSLSIRFAPMYRELISNLDEDELLGLDPMPGGYLILARHHNVPDPWVDSIATWRRLCGYDVATQRQANWSVSQVRTAIRDAYDNWAVPLEFVALFGDPQASFGMPIDGTGYDHYFALANDGDEIEDIGVGRYPVSNGTECANMFNKLMRYERTPYMADSLWYRRALISASSGMGLASNVLFANWANQQFIMHTALDSNILLLHTGALPVTPARQYIDSGIALFLWRGAWIGEIGSEFPGTLQTNPRLPVVALFACAEDVIARSFVLAGTAANPKGASAAIGVATAGSHAAYNLTTAGGLTYSMANLHIANVSHALMAGEMWLFRTYGPTAQAINHSRWTNLVGDPALAMWTEIPSTLSVEYPESLSIGARSVALQVLDSVTLDPVKDAVVVLWKGNFNDPESHSKALTDDSGRVVVPVDIVTPGEIRLAVTKQNFRPFLRMIPCDTANRHLSIESILVDDNNTGGTYGNADGLFNAGEVIDLIVQVRNYGTAGITSSTLATLTCPNSDVVISQATATYPPLAPDQIAQGSVPFRIEFAPHIENESDIVLTFTFVNDDGTSSDSRLYVMRSPDVCFQDLSQFDPFGPGMRAFLSVRIFNGGEVSMNGVEGRLISRSPFIRVLQVYSEYPDMSPGILVGSNTRFRIQADSAAFRGQMADMLLAIEDSAGFRDTVAFEIPIGEISDQDPTAPDDYGYYAHDNSDTAYGNCPEFSYLDISDIGVDLDLNDTGEDSDPSEIWSRTIVLPFPVSYYGASYDLVTVCSNGWLAFGNQAWNDCFRNFPLPGILGASNMVAPYWDDLKTSGPNQGVWAYHDAGTGKFVVQWKASGGGISFSQADLDFEVVLFDTSMHPTGDGNCKILFLYNEVTMNLDPSENPGIGGSTVGIQDSGSTIGLQYCYITEYVPGAAEIVDGRALLFTTDGPVSPDTSTQVDPTIELPSSVRLLPNFPNPFNPSTTISFELSTSSHVTLSVYDLQGRLVKQLIDAPMSAGLYSARFDGGAFSSGVYFCRLASGDYTLTQKMVLLK